MRVSKPGYCDRAVKVVALSMAVAVLTLHAQNHHRGPTPPGTPGDFHVTATTSASVTFAWVASTPGSDGGLIYEIYNDTTGLILNVGNVTSYTWTAVQSGGTYSFHIIAVAGQASAPSPEVTVTIPGAPPLPQPVKPAPPVITQTSVTSNSITVSWTESTPANEIGGYATSVNGIGDTCSSSSANPTTATCTGLWPSFNYAITVTAYSLNGTTGAISTTSAPVTVMTAASTTPPNPNAPTAPTGLTGGGDGGGEALIYWDPSTSANTPQADIQYLIYIDGVLDLFDSSVASQGTTGDTGSPSQPIYIFPRGATVPAPVWIVAVDQFGNQSARSNVLTIQYF
ncbi:MAG TPA: fibronectin type III domain-containing protein [Blastocatellia bacterium]